MKKRARTEVTAGYYLSGAVAFVPHPNQRGVWMRTDGSVLLTSCNACHALVGEPCRAASNANGGYSGSTHVDRRTRAKPLIKRLMSVPFIHVTKQNPLFAEAKHARPVRSSRPAPARIATPTIWEVRTR